MRRIAWKDHILEVRAWPLEVVTYDGRVVARRLTVFGGVHRFEVDEDGEPAGYEVRIGPRFFRGWVEVRRNGRLLFSDR